MVLKSVARIGMMLLGILLVIGAFAAVLMLGVGTNPPPLRIAVAVRDIQVGEALTASDYKIVEQILDPRLASIYVQEADSPEYEGAFVVDVFRKGDPIHKQKLAVGGTALGTSRYALVLDNPNEVIMTLPANPDIIPGKLAPGDFVNILFSSGGETGITTLPESKPNIEPLMLPPAISEGEVNPNQDTQVASREDSSISNTKPAPEIMLPLADLMLEHVPVLDVNYQQIQNPGYGDSSSEAPAFVNGAITSIVVRVPRSHQTLLTFGISSSRLRYAIASPKMETQKLKPELSMDWASYMAAYRWKQEQVAARGETLTKTLYPDFVAGQSSAMTGTLVAVATPAPQAANQPATDVVVDPASIPVATPSQ